MLNPDIVAEAVEYAATHNRLTVQIFRGNCRVATGPLDPLLDEIPFNVWSVTKSVVSLLTGIAIGDGKMNLDDAVGQYLPQEPGWGSEAHRSITIRNLLTEAAGLREAAIAEILTTETEPNIVLTALNEKVEHPNGTYFEYAQRVPDLLAFAVQQAVGQDLQSFAQQRLFGPIGTQKDDWFWLRDRSGNTYGYAHLFIKPSTLAGLGLLVQNNGIWNGNPIVPSDWIDQIQESSSTNPCYGYLFWTNRGMPCTGANIPDAHTVQRHMIPSAPNDLYAMIGFMWQDNFVIPSLDMTVTWTGAFGDYTPNLDQLLSAAPGPLLWDFFEILMRSVEDQSIPDPGPYRPDPLDLDIDPNNYLSIPVIFSNLFPSADCNVISCNSTIPTEGLIENVQSITGAVLGL